MLQIGVAEPAAAAVAASAASGSGAGAAAPRNAAFVPAAGMSKHENHSRSEDQSTRLGAHTKMLCAGGTTVFSFRRRLTSCGRERRLGMAVGSGAAFGLRGGAGSRHGGGIANARDSTPASRCQAHR